MVEFDFDIEFEEAVLNEKKKQEKKKQEKPLFPELKIKQKKTEEAERKEAEEERIEEPKIEEKQDTEIFILKTTANREDQVLDFVSSNVEKKKIPVYSLVKAHGMKGYIFVEAESQQDVEQAAYGIPYAKGILGKPVFYSDIEHMFDTTKMQANIKKNDIVEIISGPFKREKAKVTRIDSSKEDVVVELLEAAVPIPMTLKIDAVKVIRREEEKKA